MKARINTVNAFLVIMGILGYLVLLLPWYELTSHSYISGFGSSDMSAGVQSGLFIAYTSVFGYGLYLLPGVAIAMGIGQVAPKQPARVKALLLDLVGLGEAICVFMLTQEVSNASTSISGDGYGAHAGFDPQIGLWLAFGVYGLTALVGFIMMIVAPKPDAEAAANQSQTPNIQENLPTDL